MNIGGWRQKSHGSRTSFWLVQKTSPGWRPIIERILSRDVTVTIDERQLKGDPRVWDELICRLFQTFVVVNRLDTAIRQHLTAVQALA